MGCDRCGEPDCTGTCFDEYEAELKERYGDDIHVFRDSTVGDLIDYLSQFPREFEVCASGKNDGLALAFTQAGCGDNTAVNIAWSNEV